MARELDPDVVLIDLSMPGVDGFERDRGDARRRSGGAVIVVARAAPRIPTTSPGPRRPAPCGYLTKDQIADELVPGVLAAAAV